MRGDESMTVYASEPKQPSGERVACTLQDHVRCFSEWITLPVYRCRALLVYGLEPGDPGQQQRDRACFDSPGEQ